MKITVRWQDDEEGLVVCKEKRIEICRIRMYVMEESAAELSLELPEEDKEIDEKIISEMTNCFSELQAVLEEEGLPESTIVAEEGSLSAKLLNAMCSTGVVNK